MFALGLIILEQSFLYFPLILGAYISISLMKMPDLSIESAYVFGAILATKVLPFHTIIPTAVLLPCVLITAMIGGAIVGGIASSFTQFARIPHLLSSILTIGLFHGVNQFVLGQANVSLGSYANPLMNNMFFPRNPELLILSIIFLILLGLGYFFLQTQLGFSLVVFGNNQGFFGHYGISKPFICCFGVMLANALAGLSGYFVVQSSGFIDIGAGFGIALFSVTTLILGKTVSFSSKPSSIIVPILGVISYCFIQQLLLKVGFNLKYFTMIQSGIVLGILVNKFRKSDRISANTDNLGV